MKTFVNNQSFTKKAIIVTQTPMRITLGGGGTDVMWYSKMRGGAWISAAINKYVYIFLNKTDDPDIIKIFDGSESYMVNNINQIQNSVVRACLKKAKIKKGLQVTTISEVSSGSGLGGSGAFEVGLLNGLYAIQNKKVSKLTLAEQATNIEVIQLKKSVGPQDQYIVSLGGIHYFEISKKGKVTSQKLKLSNKTIKNLQKNLLYFSTGIQRDADSVLGDSKRAAENFNDSKVIDSLDQIKVIGQKVKGYLKKGKVDEFGLSLHKHWLIKKSLSTKVTNDKIDNWYDQGIKNGALGGKIMGAGGGGWFMFYVNKNHEGFKRKMKKIGLIPQEVIFDWKGTRVII